MQMTPRTARVHRAAALLRARRFTASLRKGRSLATHVIAAGVTDPKAVSAVAGGLRSAAQRLGVAPVRTARTRRTVRGRSRLRRVQHFTAAQVARLAASYKPRKPEYVAAVILLTA